MKIPSDVVNFYVEYFKNKKTYMTIRTNYGQTFLDFLADEQKTLNISGLPLGILIFAIRDQRFTA